MVSSEATVLCLVIQGLIGAGSSRVSMVMLFQDASELYTSGDVFMSSVRLFSLGTTVDWFLISSRVIWKSWRRRHFPSISIRS